MPIQYLTDEQGRKTAVQVPIEEWEALLERIDPDDELSPEEMAEAEAGWREYLEGKSKPLEQVMREQLDERND